MNLNKELVEFIYTYPTKYKEGFLPEEEKEVLKEFPGINMKKYNDALTGTTGEMKKGKLLTYRCGVENRDIKLSEWD